MTVTRTAVGCVLAVVVGELDRTSLDEFAGALETEPAPRTRAMVVDLSRVPFCAICGLEELLDLLRRTNQVGVPLALVVDTHTVRRALTASGLADVFPTYVDRTSALAAVDAASPRAGVA